VLLAMWGLKDRAEHRGKREHDQNQALVLGPDDHLRRRSSTRASARRIDASDHRISAAVSVMVTA
jgi:hypothetical protein